MTSKSPKKIDRMESFVFARTFKYYFLLVSFAVVSSGPRIGSNVFHSFFTVLTTGSSFARRIRFQLGCSPLPHPVSLGIVPSSDSLDRPGSECPALALHFDSWLRYCYSTMVACPTSLDFSSSSSAAYQEAGSTTWYERLHGSTSEEEGDLDP